MLLHKIVGEVLWPATTSIASAAKLCCNVYFLLNCFQEAPDYLLTYSRSIYICSINKVSTGINKCLQNRKGVFIIYYAPVNASQLPCTQSNFRNVSSSK